MSLIFSKVTLKGKNKTASFLVGGIPQNVRDLIFWKQFREGCKTIRETDYNESFDIQMTVFEYGNEKRYSATPEEVAYFYQRIKRNSEFLNDSCTKIAEYLNFERRK